MHAHRVVQFKNTAIRLIFHEKLKHAIIYSDRLVPAHINLCVINNYDDYRLTVLLVNMRFMQYYNNNNK